MRVSETRTLDQLIDTLKYSTMEIGATGRKVAIRDKDGKILNKVSLNDLTRQMEKICGRYQKGKPVDKTKVNVLAVKINKFHDEGNLKLKKSTLSKILTSIAQVKNLFGDLKKDLGLISKDREAGIERFRNHLIKLSGVLAKEDKHIGSRKEMIEDVLKKPMEKKVAAPAKPKISGGKHGDEIESIEHEIIGLKRRIANAKKPVDKRILTGLLKGAKERLKELRGEQSVEVGVKRKRVPEQQRAMLSEVIADKTMRRDKIIKDPLGFIKIITESKGAKRDKLLGLADVLLTRTKKGGHTVFHKLLSNKSILGIGGLKKEHIPAIVDLVRASPELLSTLDKSGTHGALAYAVVKKQDKDLIRELFTALQKEGLAK